MNQTAGTLLLAQQGPTYGHTQAYEQGQAVGRFAAIAVIGAIVLFAIYKFFKR